MQPALGGCNLVISMSSAVWAGKRGEDRVVATHRPWPSGLEGLGIPAPPALSRSASTGRQMLGGGWLCPGNSYHLFAVFDGHNGAEAARFAAHSVADIVDAFLPARPHPAAFPSEADELAEQLQEALVLACLELNRQFATTGAAAGCTATLALLVGRLLTVASVGSSSCVLDCGDPGCLLTLSEDHRISRNVGERRRLLAAGCQVAALDASGAGPALGHGRSTGALRVWPGGLTLSRAVGDFGVGGEGILALPHIKQVVLPPSGGRLILASDGVWSVAGEGLTSIMHTAQLKTAAHEVVKAISTSRHHKVDASIIVVDALPPGDTFPALCKRRRGDSGGATPGLTRSGSGKQKLLRMLGLGGSTRWSSKVAEAGAQQALEPEQQADAELLADFDSADLLSLVPEPCFHHSKPSSQGSPPSVSRSASASSVGSDSLATAGGRNAAAARRDRESAKPDWIDAQTEHQMRSSVVEARQLWQLARQRRRCPKTVTFAELPTRRSSRSVPDLQLLEATASGQMPQLIADAAPSPRSGSDASAADRIGPSPFAAAASAPPSPPPLPHRLARHQPALSPTAPLVLRSSSLSRIPGIATAASEQRRLTKQHSGFGAATTGQPAAPQTPGAAYQSSGSASALRSGGGGSESDGSDGGQTIMSGASSVAPSPRRSILRSSSGVQRFSGFDDELISPRRRLPPLQTGPMARQGSLPAPATPALEAAPPGGRRPPLPRSQSSAAALLTGGSGAPQLQAGSSRRSSLSGAQAGQGERTVSPNSQWLQGYCATADMHRRGGRDRLRRTASTDTSGFSARY